MPDVPWRIFSGDGPLVATAIHHGHDVRPEVRERMALPEDRRLNEEDPFTGPFTAVAPTRIIVERSRFEVDLNRPRENAVYRRPEDAWGIRVWRGELPDDVCDRSLAIHDAFYSTLGAILWEKERRYGAFVVFDLHSYNHRRDGPDAPPQDPAANPEVNLGTGSMDRQRWGALADRFMEDLRSFDFGGRHLDVRENVRFRGAELCRFVHARFPKTGCGLAIEFKKFFMDEWTGETYPEIHGRIPEALRATVPGILEELEKVRSAR